MKAHNVIPILFFCISLVFLTGCAKDKFDEIDVTYNGTLAFPVAQVGFTLGEALDDDSLFVVDSENAISVIYRDENFYTLSAAEFLDDITGDLISTQTESFTVGNVMLEDFTTFGSTTFGEIVDGFEDASLRDFFQQNDGNSFPIPAFVEEVENAIAVPAFSDFVNVEIESGMMRARAFNSLFFEIHNMEVDIVDNANGQVVGTLFFDVIPIGVETVGELDLSGKSFSNDLRLEMGRFESPGTEPDNALINLESSVSVAADMVDIVVKSGQVKLPSGPYVEGSYPFRLTPDNDERIYKIQLETGTIDYSLTSSLQAGILLRLTFPDVFRDGQPVMQEIAVPANPGAPLTGTLFFTNTIWQLDQDVDEPYNLLRIEYEIELPTGTSDPVSFSADDAIDFELILNGLEPVLVEGYFGQKMETIEPGNIDLGFDFDFLDEASAPLLFDDPTIVFKIQNSFGVPLGLSFNATAQGTFGATASLNPPDLLTINYPDIGMAGQTVETTLTFDKNNSSIVDLLGVFPDIINYEGSASANPENDLSIVNFVTAGSEFMASAEIEMPLKFRAENLIYEETGAALNLDLEEGLTIDDIDSAILKIVYANDLPLRAEFNVNILSADGTETTVIDDVILEAATPNSTGRVDPGGEATGEVFIRLSRDQIMQLDEAVENVYLVRFQTAENGQVPSTMYTDYNVDLNIGMTITFDR